MITRSPPPRRGRNRKAQAGGTPLAGSALGILFPHPRRAEGPPETLITTKYTKNRQRLLEEANLALEVLRFPMGLAKSLQGMKAGRIIEGIPISQPVT